MDGECLLKRRKSFWVSCLLCFLMVVFFGDQCLAQSECETGKIFPEMTFGQTSDVTEDSKALTVFEAPEGTIMGVYAWDENLLIYYYADGYYMLSRMDSVTGNTLSVTDRVFTRELQIEFSQDNLTLLPGFSGTGGSQKIKIQDLSLIHISEPTRH